MAKEVPRDKCCLCGKTKVQVGKLIVGLHGAVCDGCIDLCVDILRLRPKPVHETTADGGYVLEIPPQIARTFTDPDEVREILHTLARAVERRAGGLAWESPRAVETKTGPEADTE